MRKYYLFKIKPKNSKYNLKKIYLVLEELFYLNSNKFKYGVSIFNDLCMPLNKNEIIGKLKKKFRIENSRIIVDELEYTMVSVNNACILIKTSKNISMVFKYLNQIDQNLFVCDFDNQDYFMLDNFIKLNLKIAI